MMQLEESQKDLDKRIPQLENDCVLKDEHHRNVIASKDLKIRHLTEDYNEQMKKNDDNFNNNKELQAELLELKNVVKSMNMSIEYNSDVERLKVKL